MLKLTDIIKRYTAGDSKVDALRGVSLNFRDSEFVSVLGPSGCGKTTLLNIVGGLDRYTSGDLSINGRSTKEYTDADWDNYRNRSIGFVFQSYNLIPHQTVLANVELALTLSGVSKAERRRRAAEALTRVGLADQLKKKPTQMSGGQMQRVAIARALVNNPDILLADEPTGALDTQTSVQVMDILKEIARDRLVIMVTHNRELAERYSTRIISLLDGNVTDDTLPYDGAEPGKTDAASVKLRKKHKRETSMSFFTAMTLSLDNLLTKRARTLLTSFAGGIGIIGIALILALSTGVQNYIDDVQRDTLSSYPITIEDEQTDITSIFSALKDVADKDTGKAELSHERDAVYSDSRMYDLFNAVFNPEVSENDLTSFKAYLDGQLAAEPGSGGLRDCVSSVQYLYGVKFDTYVKDPDGEWANTDMTDAFKALSSDTTSQTEQNRYSNMESRFSNLNLWQELMPGKDGALISDMIYVQYDLVYGSWPQSADQVVLILDKNNEISDIAFYSLGLMSRDEVDSILSAVVHQDEINVSSRTLDYADACNLTFKLLIPGDYYTDSDGDGVWSSIEEETDQLGLVINSAYELHISGIIRPKEDASATALTGVFGYTSALTDHLIDYAGDSPVVTAQKSDANTNLDILTGLPFTIAEAENPTDEYKTKKIKEYFDSLDDTEKTKLYTQIVSEPSDEYVQSTLEQYMAQYTTRDEMEALVAQAYGMDAETVKSYLASYTDDGLRDMMKQQITTLITQQYAATALEGVKAIMTTPSDAELDAIKTSITGQLISRELKIAYIISDWSKKTEMPAMEIMAYLSGLDDAQLDALTDELATAAATEYYASSAQTYTAAGYAKVAAVFDEKYGSETDTTALAGYYDKYMPSETSDSTLEDNLSSFGAVDPATPKSINIYASTFEDKDAIADEIAKYNESAGDEQQIVYTDYVALLMSGITGIINAISYGLIVFVSISLVVSSIMIGIITYISVLERTKEIGILRSVGASKRDVSMVFNAETLIVGFAAGAIGIGISLLLCIPISALIHRLSGVTAINAFIRPEHCAILILISMILTLIAGIIPSRIAAKKDPVEALRSE